ncbi:non-specific lipid-transfer protein 1-like [Ananas comosus]|uniref:Non-specific lipid-transfer protein n=2 Tax=Ananas comosus TaxID=4615 RepID=A0A6P5G291_ANACO|nr:non-specific lipid-transfer protein 1-like [Ananas comosus]CAD1822020.1 unnamed protein product [Ananas comosus var. bracteatus]
MARVAATLLLALVASTVVISGTEAAITCGQVSSLLSQCIAYARSGTGTPPAGCCSGVRSLNAAAQSTADRQAACNCLKQEAASVSGLKPGAISSIPSACGVSVPYTISTSTDCSKVH